MQNNIKAIIVEDVKKFHAVIETFLDEVAPNVQIVANATNLNEAKEYITRFSPQLVFLDIQFDAEGKTAFDLLKELSEQKKLDFQIIIITAFNQTEYYDEAFNYGALHFLTKPIDKLKLKQAVERVSQNINQPTENQLLSQFIQFHEQVHLSKASNKIIVEGLTFAEVVLLNNIVYLEASGRYTDIYLINAHSKPICSSTNLGEYEKRLANHPDFFRVHRNLIVNTNYILRFSKKDRSIFLPDPFPKQYASKDRFKEFLKSLGDKDEA
ncbi:MAG TPA: LytTR family DNA-binding domain-containing protein [Prolixibacteraceae bacterium]|nr:LytTR family DNA-binding domain-containing protein [Prolixibacteraceae bacterium]